MNTDKAFTICYLHWLITECKIYDKYSNNIKQVNTKHLNSAQAKGQYLVVMKF